MNEYSYDEDLTNNRFLQELKNKHQYFIDRATTEGWIICIPKNGSVENTTLTEEDFLHHVLIPNEEGNYRTLNGKELTVKNRVIIIKNDTIVSSLNTPILFEETFYTEKFDSYKVWCIECLLNQTFIKSKFNSNCSYSVLTLRDCIDFLWRESLGKEILEQLDAVINNFLSQYNKLHEFSLSHQRDLIYNLYYTQCLGIALSDVKLSESMSKNKYNLNNINISVEAYMQHSLYKTLFNSIAVHTACDDSNFNKIVRNFSDLQLRDLDILPVIYDTIPCAKHQLAKINGFSTVLGKIGCLRNTVSEIGLSKTNLKLSADILLPALVFLILKSCVPNWIANLHFLKEYQFSCLSSGDETDFLITTLEAAIEYIKSGIFTSNDHIFVENGEKNDLSYLFNQIQLGNYEEVKFILSKNATSLIEFETRSKELCHPLCSCDKCEGILSQITSNTSPNVYSSNDRGHTALHIACIYGKPKIVEILLEYDANINRCDFSGATPLHYAAMKGHQNALLLLLHSGADLNATDNEKNTPLHFSCNNGHVGCVKAILYFSEHRTNLLNINCSNLSGDTPLHLASRWGYKNIVHILLEHGALPTIENKLKKTPYDYAHNLKIYDIMQGSFITKQNKKVEQKSDDTILEYDFLDDNKQDVKEEKPKKPCSPREMKKAELLLRAVAYDDLPMICYYLGLPLPSNHTKNENITLCHPLCTCEKCETSEDNITINLKDKQDINVCNSEGYTALHVASLHGQTDIVKLLLSNGALPNVTTNKGLTALHLACQTERVEIVKLLLGCDGCRVNLQDYKGHTALHFACHSRELSIIKMLLINGADINICNEHGETALDEADGKIVGFIQNFKS